MPAKSQPPAVTFNPFVSPQLENPYPTMAVLREQSPVFFSELLGAWVITRYEDITAVLRDTTRFSSRSAAALPPELPASVQAILADGYREGALVTADPPEHGRWRSAFNKFFLSPARMAALAPRIEALAEELVDGFIAEGRVELMSRFASPLTLRVLMEMSGLPAADMDRVKAGCDAWSALLFAPLTVEQQQASARATCDYQRYILGVLKERYAQPGEDFISVFIHAPMPGERPGDADYAAQAAGTLLAGNESTTCLIGSAVHLLLEQRGLWAALCAQPDLIPKAVEEILRIDPPFLALIRTTTTACEIGGVAIPEGARIVPLFGAGNRDPKQFSAPDQCQFARANVSAHLAFGKGIHFCPGAPLARLEARISLEVLTRRLSSPRLAPQPIPYIAGLLRGPRELVVEWDPPSAAR